MELLGPEPTRELRKEPLLKFKVLRKPKPAKELKNPGSASMVAYKKELLPALSQRTPPKRLPTPRCLVPIRLFEHPFYVKKRRRYAQMLRKKEELSETVDFQLPMITNSMRPRLCQPESPHPKPISEQRLPKREPQPLSPEQSIKELLGSNACSLSERRQAKVAGVLKYFSLPN